MTVKEFSDEFDTQVRALAVDLSFDEYEKSVFLTEAQENVVMTLYSGKLTGEGFEETEQSRRFLSELLRTYKTSIQDRSFRKGVSDNSQFFHLPDDVLYITYEAATITDRNGTESIIEVIPTTQDEYHRTRENPFKRPNKRRALRLDYEEGVVEIVSNYNINEYLVKYLAKPEPIILLNLPEDLTINKCSTENECKLNSALHRTILEMAVKSAISSKQTSKT